MDELRILALLDGAERLLSGLGRYHRSFLSKALGFLPPRRDAGGLRKAVCEERAKATRYNQLKSKELSWEITCHSSSTL